MLTLKLIQEQTQYVIDRLAVKCFDAKEIVAKIIELDNKRKATQVEGETAQN